MSARVYWRRRLLLLVVVVLLVWGLVKLVEAVRGDDPEPSSGPASTPSATESSGAPTPKPSQEPDPGLLAVTLGSDEAPCDPETVRITPTVPAHQQAGGDVDVDLAVSSTAASSCTLTPDDAGLVAVIGSGNSTVWDSTRCPTSLLADPVEISARWTTVVRVEWSARRSGGGCSDDEPYADAGDYVLKLGTLGGEPGKASFTLEKKVDKEKDEKDAG